MMSKLSTYDYILLALGVAYLSYSGYPYFRESLSVFVSILLTGVLCGLFLLVLTPVLKLLNYIKNRWLS